MQNVLVEFNKDFTFMDLHANFSLSHLAGSIESMPGIVLVQQASIYDIEAYLDRTYFETTLQRQALQVKLKRLFNEYGIAIQYGG